MSQNRMIEGIFFSYHASDKIVGILLDRSRSRDAVKITVLGVEIRIGRVIEFEAGSEQSRMADDKLVAMDLFLIIIFLHRLFGSLMN